jgi:hypothetical protein
MSKLYNYIFAKKEIEKETKILKEIFVKVSEKPKYINVFLVINKSNKTPLGIYDNLEQAKISGQEATYHNCEIIPFTLNDKCKFISTSIFEN